MYRATGRYLMGSFRYREYRSFMKKLRPVEVANVPIHADIQQEPTWTEYSQLAKDHPKYQAISNSARQAAIREAIRFDKLMRLPGVYTVCSRSHMLNLTECVESVLRDNIPGDLLEAGTRRGGMAMLMKEVLRRHGDLTRTVWLADAWTGHFPKPQSPNDAAAAPTVNRLFSNGPNRDEVIENFKQIGLWDERLEFVEGYFENTLPHIRVNRLSVLRLDADFYSSTMDVLTHLYPKLSPGGYVIIDDYGLPICDCKKAVDEYRAKHGIAEVIKMADIQCGYWRKT
jgi:O-methyltransferase